tara:strand:+ start:1623 stop:1742 length:120 start_codon:yes stop_codon:yes gene_type:complete
MAAFSFAVDHHHCEKSGNIGLIAEQPIAKRIGFFHVMQV